ncbi:hypothetical protein SFRURICE_004412 [Spodoptera frugiperda]|nr:hypothetical protein SFRURICE_004412 [Spodoptera frugiperda]
METCVRGFSFMAENKADMVDLQFIEGGELERAWRSNRRERMKQREQKIWDKFVEEQDVVKGVCTDDPYQFLDQLPESCLKEIMDTERQRIPKEKSVEEVKPKELPQPSSGNHPSGDDGQHTCVVTFAADIDKGNCDMFHIFDDDQSGPEEEVFNEPESLETVRDKQVEQCPHSPERHIALEKTSSKSSENVTHVIESSIYCAKVKDLRMKINEELISLMTTLDRRDILTSEPDDIMRMVKRSAEFCGRFNRIYMYQLQRQIHDIKRNNSVSLPFAKHTQFQSQMVRIVSLHQNILQSFQVFHKSVSQTCCVRESASALGSLIACVRDSTHMCLNVPPPKDFTAALDLYKDDLTLTCDKVDDFVGEYAIRCEEFLNSFVNVNTMNNPRKAPKKQMKKRGISNWNKSQVKNDAEARLSMYSLDTLRLNLHPKSTSSKDNQSSSIKKTGAKEAATPKSKRQSQNQAEKPVEAAKGPKNPAIQSSTGLLTGLDLSRRPLMRDPHAGRPRAPKPIRENDIRTMVEAVETVMTRIYDCTFGAVAGQLAAAQRVAVCFQPHKSRGVPPSAGRGAGVPAAQGGHPAPRAAHPAHPHPARPTHATHTTQNILSTPTPITTKNAITTPMQLTINSTYTTNATHASFANIVAPTSLSESEPRRSAVPYTAFRPRPKIQPSPRNKKRPEDQKPKRPHNFSTVKEAGSGTRTDLESEDMMTPVCKIRCAMKKSLEPEDAKLSGREQSVKKSPSRHRMDPNEKKKRDPRQSFISLRRAGLQCSGVSMFVSTVDPGLQELQRYGRSIVLQLQPLQAFPDTPRLVPGLKLHGSPPKKDTEDSAKYGECSKTEKEAPAAPNREPSSDRKDRSKVRYTYVVNQER